MQRRTKLLLLWISSMLAMPVAGADNPGRFPYCENRVQPVTFDAQGTWELTGIAGHAHVSWLQKNKQQHLIGSFVRVSGTRVDFWNKRVMSWKEPFATPVIGQQTYDTQSREFWLDLRTDPSSIDLPRYVSAVNVELATIVATAEGRVYLNYAGVWFTLMRRGQAVQSGHAGSV